MTDSDAFKADLARLKAEFAGSLSARLAEIAAARKMFVEAQAETRAAALKKLVGLAHKLAGSAGTYGYPELSAAARTLNDDGKAMLTGGAPLDAHAVERIAVLVDRIMASAGDAALCAGPAEQPARPESRRTFPDLLLRAPSLIYVPALLVALGVLIAGIYADRLNERKFLDDQRAAVSDKLAADRGRLEGYIHTNIGLVKGVAAAITVEPDMSGERFAALARPLVSETAQLHNISAAPGLVVRYVYPLKGNEAALGFDVGNHPTQREAALRARDSGEMTLAGPVDLVQGGQGFIGRFPVFVDRGPGQRRAFWGVMSGVIDAKRLYDAVGFLDDRRSIEIAIRGKDGLGSKGELFFGRAEVFESDPVLASVVLPDGTWQMAAIPKGGWPARADDAWTLRLGMLFGGGLIVLLVGLATWLLRQQQESHEHLIAAIESMDAAAALYDAADRLVLFNQHYLELLRPVAGQLVPGVTYEQLLRRLIASNRYLDPTTDAEDFIARRLAAHRQAKGVPAYRLADGSWIRVDEYRTSDGGVFVFIRDITETRLAEESLRASEARFRDLTEISSDWIWETGPDGRFTYLSDGFTRRTGYPKEFLLEKTREEKFVVRVPGDEAIWENFRRTLGGRQPFLDFRYCYRRPDGTVGWVSLRGSPVFAADGNFRGYRGATREITQQIKFEEDLRDAKLAADAANRAKSDFLSNMSHELRTPLNAVLGFGQLLKYNSKEPLTAKQAESVDIILKGGQHLLTLITEILDLARIESGKVALSIEDVSISAVFDELRTMLAPMAKKAKITFDISPPEPDITIRADYTRAKQVLLNFASNAIKYNFEGGRVVVRAFMVPGGKLRLSVADTGPGISPAKQSKLFQPFNRLGAETTGIEGTGIGLALSKQLVEIMGGAIGFESEISVGSTFWVDFPLAKRPTVAAIKGCFSGVEEEVTGVYSDIRGTVLCIEDNPENLKLMELIFSRVEGVTLWSADTAERGLLIATERKPDIIIMDINLPGMNGFQALERLKREARTRATPVIALSAHATAHDIERGELSGFFRYLTKPVDVGQLLRIVRKALDREK